MVEAGGGIFLAQDWDLEVDETGDIRTVEGVAELEKDLAFYTARVLRPVEGLPQNPQTRSVIQARIERAINTEPRVRSILSLDISYPDRQTVEVITTVSTVEGNQELVFEVDR